MESDEFNDPHSFKSGFRKSGKKTRKGSGRKQRAKKKETRDSKFNGEEQEGEEQDEAESPERTLGSNQIGTLVPDSEAKEGFSVGRAAQSAKRVHVYGDWNSYKARKSFGEIDKEWA